MNNTQLEYHLFCKSKRKVAYNWGSENSKFVTREGRLFGQWTNSSILHGNIRSLIHRKCDPKSYRSDTKYRSYLVYLVDVGGTKMTSTLRFRFSMDMHPTLHEGTILHETKRAMLMLMQCHWTRVVHNQREALSNDLA